jgi:hypothetical protein
MSSSINAVLGCLQTPSPPGKHSRCTDKQVHVKPTRRKLGKPHQPHPPVRGEKTRQSQPFPIRPPSPGMFRYGLRIRISHITSHHITSSVVPLGNPVASALRLHCGCIACVCYGSITKRSSLLCYDGTARCTLRVYPAEMGGPCLRPRKNTGKLEHSMPCSRIPDFPGPPRSENERGEGGEKA